MRRGILAKLTMALALCLLLAVFAGCDGSAPQGQPEVEIEEVEADEDIYDEIEEVEPEPEPEPEPDPEPEPPPQMTREEFDIIRAGIPQPGLQPPIWIEHHGNSNIPFLIDSNDELAMQIWRYLNMISFVVGGREIQRHQLSESCVVDAAMFSSALISTIPSTGGSMKEIYVPGLEPVNSFHTAFWLREHVDESIRLLFGEDMVPESPPPGFAPILGNILYYERLDVFVPLPFGGGRGVIHSVILDYEDLGNRYRILVAYIHDGLGGYTSPRTREEIEGIKDPEEGHVIDFAAPLLAYVQNPANQFHMYLTRRGDGSLLFEKQVAAA